MDWRPVGWRSRPALAKRSGSSCGLTRERATPCADRQPATADRRPPASLRPGHARSHLAPAGPLSPSGPPGGGTVGSPERRRRLMEQPLALLDQAKPWGLGRMRPYPTAAVLPAARPVLDPGTQVPAWVSPDGTPLTVEATSSGPSPAPSPTTYSTEPPHDQPDRTAPPTRRSRPRGRPGMAHRPRNGAP
ncbi:putative ATP-grasp-modified RiPP [Streptomyces echinatus]|uniref:putative ATP-grasp-modified RiPP n=1 Tax=Streptomyces echinatus TaxID=67293 RepID=UPI0037B509E4